ncbi:MAG: diguanylate cyclase [Rubrivivax sp.]|nr:diguanylate cyclase [Rubrivivax sp.]
MDPLSPPNPSPTALAKGALRRLAQAQLEPTPENYARAYAEESGRPPPAPPAAAPPAPPLEPDAKAQGAAWAGLVERLARNLERGGRQWTAGRRKESLRRVLDGSRSDAQRLLQRLQSLMTAWEADLPSDSSETGIEDPPVDASAVLVGSNLAAPASDLGRWPPLVDDLQATVRAGLPPDEARAAELASELGRLADAVAAEGATPMHVAAVAAICDQARRLFAHRHRLVEGLAGLCRELSAGLTELAEDDSWAQGQCAGLRARLEDGLSVRGVHAASQMLAETRAHHLKLRGERAAARDALKQLLHDMLREVGELGEHTGRFQTATARHAEAIEKADTLESLADVVQSMLEDSRAIHAAVTRSQERMQADRARASELETRVRDLESELRRLSDEVSTDALTQVANRRGLAQAFEAESARAGREASPQLAVALIDIDNFKKLNDSLGHAAGDVALKSLASAVRERLRPVDHLARFGGEEFVVLLPGTGIEEAQQALTRLQRSLSAALFMHDGREVFVTFSSGVTAWRSGEALAVTLERADEALYEAKRTGKNRTCVA